MKNKNISETLNKVPVHFGMVETELKFFDRKCTIFMSKPDSFDNFQKKKSLFSDHCNV